MGRAYRSYLPQTSRARAQSETTIRVNAEELSEWLEHTEAMRLELAQTVQELQRTLSVLRGLCQALTTLE